MPKHNVAISDSGRHGISKFRLRARFHSRKSSSSCENSGFFNSDIGSAIEGPVDSTIVLCATDSVVLERKG